MKLYMQTLHGRPFYAAGLEITPVLSEYEVDEATAKELRSLAKTATTKEHTPLLSVTDKKPVTADALAQNAALAARVKELQKQLADARNAAKVEGSK